MPHIPQKLLQTTWPQNHTTVLTFRKVGAHDVLMGGSRVSMLTEYFHSFNCDEKGD